MGTLHWGTRHFHLYFETLFWYAARTPTWIAHSQRLKKSSKQPCAQISVLWTECCVPQNTNKLVCWVLTPSVMVFGNGVFARSLGLDWVLRVGPRISGIVQKRKRERCQSLSPHMHTYQGKAMWGHSKNADFCKPGRGPSPDTKSAGTLILDF